MKELVIIRHGKSSWDVEGISDIDRTLKERGINDGYKVAERLISKGIKPDKIFSSSAARAIHSALIFARILGYPSNEITAIEDIYNAEINRILNLIKQVNGNIQTLMLFGHNPTFTELANHFVGNKIDNIPTTGIVHIKFSANSWPEVDKSNVEDWLFDFPKNIR